FQVLNRATTTAGPGSLSVSRSFENGQNGLVVNGSIRRGGGPAVFHRAVEEPALYAAHAFREIARSERIEIRGSLTVGTVPERAREIHVHESQPLGALVRDLEVGPELVSSLPIGGADGTLDERFGGEESRRRVRAKTGRVAGALTLAGYVTNRDGRTFAFVMLANRPRGTIDAMHRAIDRLV